MGPLTNKQISSNKPKKIKERNEWEKWKKKKINSELLFFVGCQSDIYSRPSNIVGDNGFIKIFKHACIRLSCGPAFEMANVYMLINEFKCKPKSYGYEISQFELFIPSIMEK